MEDDEEAPTPAPAVQDEAVDMAVDSGHEEDQRAAQEKLFQDMKIGGALPSVIKAQEAVVNALPKPKLEKPLLDAGRLHTALSVAKEHYSKIATADNMLVEQCELAIRTAQEALNNAKRIQQENIQLAEKKLNAIKVQIAKAQENSKDELKLPETESKNKVNDDPDFALVKNDFLDTVTKLNLPPHLVTFMDQVEFVPKSVVSTSASSGNAKAAAAEKSTQEPKVDSQPKAAV